MAYIVRVWLLTPPAGFVHPKTEVLRVAARRGKIALRAKKIDPSGAMRVVGRGAAEELAAFNGDLHHKVVDGGWVRNELAATEADVASIEGGGVVILRSEESVTSGVGRPAWSRSVVRTTTSSPVRIACTQSPVGWSPPTLQMTCTFAVLMQAATRSMQSSGRLMHPERR
jgi:hypothetical protein